MRITALLPIFVVAAILGVFICIYPYTTDAHDAIAWPALTNFYSKDFRDAGFHILCETTAAGTLCILQWTNPTSTKATPIDVYVIGEEQHLRRDEILLRFHEAVTKSAGSDEASRVTAVLDGFFQSGLRRLADRGVRRASSRVESLQFPPFRLTSARMAGGKEIRDVAGLENAYSTILTGLPKRPEYRADVFASAGLRSDKVSTVRIVPSSGRTVTRLLDPSSTTTCDPLYPSASGTNVPCKKIDITVCNPASDHKCKTAVLQVHAAGPGLVLMRGGASTVGRPLSRGALPMTSDELVVALAKNARFDPIHVETAAGYRDFRVEIVHGSRTPISRQRMVNGRWERWYVPMVRPWVEPLITRWDQLAQEDPPIVDPRAPVELSLDLNLQRDLETRLAEWMKVNAEKKVVDHLISDHYHRKGSRSIDYRPGENGHRRAVPQAGVTVLDAESGQILAVASYPPAEAFTVRGGEPAVTPGWRERFGGSIAPGWARRQILETLADRITDETNANFSAHPIGSTFKPILLSLMIDTAPPSGGSDQLATLFDLMVAGHPQVPQVKGIACRTCGDAAVQATAGFPVGPWGNEDGGGTHGSDDWVDRSEFIVSSCNKYAITLGLLSLVQDWTQTGNVAACCWNAARDSFGFATAQNLDGGSPPPMTRYASADQLPPFGPWVDSRTVSTNASFPDAPVFRRLRDYYDVSSRSLPNPYDQQPFAPCVRPTITSPAQMPPMGTLARTQLTLTGQPIGPAFTNFFTGSGHNWWTNVKLAEAYARLASNRETLARFCGGGAKPANAELFRLTSRYEELMQIMSRQKKAHWVQIPAIKQWIDVDPAKRGTLSKTGTSLRSAGHESTGIFAIYIGNATTASDPEHHATRGGKGIVVVAHVDDLGTKLVGPRKIGASEQVTQLVDSLFDVLRMRLEP